MLAVYPGTFDPFTLGHLDILKRSSCIFSKVILAVSESPAKSPVVNFKDRTEIVKLCASGFPNVSVEPFTGMLVDFLQERNAGVLVRGIRNLFDCEYELTLQAMYKKLMPSLEIVMLPASPNVSFISSTLVRDVIRHYGDITPFVPPEVSKYLTEHERTPGININS